MDEIILRFVSHPGLFDCLTRWFQGNFAFTHVEAFWPDGGVIGAWFDGGVRIRPRDYDAGGFTREAFVRVPATAAQRAAFYGFLRSQIGKPYDSLAIAAFAAGRDWQAPDSWYCAEIAAKADMEAGIVPALPLVEASKVTVKDYWMLHARDAVAG